MPSPFAKSRSFRWGLQLGIMLAIAGSAGAASSFSPAPDAPDPAPLVMGYYPSYAEALPPQNIRYDRFTHLIHAFATADEAGRAETSGNLPSVVLTSMAHARGVKVWLGLSGAENGELFGMMARDPAKRGQFVADVVRLMATNGYDGVVVDWEFPTANDKSALNALILDLRAGIRAVNPAAMLALAVPASGSESEGFDGPFLRDHVDFLHIMTYDLHGPWNHAGHNSPLYASALDAVDGDGAFFEEAVSYWRDTVGFRPAQILVGIANYGRGFKTDAWGQTPNEASQYPEIAFNEVGGLIANGWTRRWDAEAMVPWIEREDGTERISYDDEVSVAAKAQWAHHNHLAGYFFWEISQDMTEGDNVLALAAAQGWQRAER